MDDIDETFDKKLIGLAADGANVNRGDKDGSYQHAQKELSVCDMSGVAQRLELALKDVLQGTTFYDVDEV